MVDVKVNVFVAEFRRSLFDADFEGLIQRVGGATQLALGRTCWSLATFWSISLNLAALFSSIDPLWRSGQLGIRFRNTSIRVLGLSVAKCAGSTAGDGTKRLSRPAAISQHREYIDAHGQSGPVGGVISRRYAS